MFGALAVGIVTGPRRDNNDAMNPRGDAIALGEAARPSKALNIVLWIFHILAVGMFLVAGGLKLAGAEPMVALIQRIPTRRVMGRGTGKRHGPVTRLTSPGERVNSELTRSDNSWRYDGTEPSSYSLQAYVFFLGRKQALCRDAALAARFD